MHLFKNRLTLIACLSLIACGGGGGGTGGTSAEAEHVPINTAGWADSPFLSRDSQRLYFMYSRWNYFPSFTGGLPVLLGPDRIGLNKHNQAAAAYEESDLYVATRRPDGSWGEATILPFNHTGGDASGMSAGSGFYYARSPGGGANPDIFVSQYSGGVWSAPAGLSAAINTSYIEDNPHVSASEDGIWFSSDRPGGYGGKDLYFSIKTNGVWSAPVNLGPTINTNADEDQPWVDPNGSGWMYFNRNSQIYRSQLLNGSFSTPSLFSIPGQPYVGDISFSDDGQNACFASADPASQRIRILCMSKLGNGNWGPVVPVD